MKKNFFKLASVAMTACFVCVVTFVFQSCNSDTDELVQEVAFEQDVKTAFKNDLRFFTMKQKLLNSNTKIGWNSNSGLFEGTRVSGMTKEDYRAQLEQNLKPIFEKYDFTADLTPHELEGFNLSQEQKEILALDEEAYRVYIKEYKTEAYCKFFDEFAANPMKASSLLDKALNNDEMKMNEMLQMAIVLSVFENYSLFQETRSSTDANQEAAIDCYDEYLADRRVCMVGYFAAVGVSIIWGGGAPGLIAGTVVAVVTTHYCLETALRDYRRCKEYMTRR